MTTIQFGTTTINLEALEEGIQEALEGFKSQFPQEEDTYLWAQIKMAFRVEAFKTTPNVTTYAKVKLFQNALMNGNLEAVKSYVEGE